MTHIYVVGYPKSGNTWLTRMIARATRFPVKTPDGSQPEVAADVNREIERIKGVEEGSVFKLHEMPNIFEGRLIREAGKQDTKVVYIYRDVGDVFISSFFYFKHNGIERYIKKPSDFMSFFNPMWLAKRVFWRIQFNRYLGSFIHHGYNKEAVTYANHLSGWFAYLKSCDDKFDYAVTKYEDLIDDPVHELERICNRIGFHDLDIGLLESTVKSESFSDRKKAIERASDELTFGKEFNIKFLRTGKASDYKRFLTKGQAMRLQKAVQNIVNQH